MALSRAEARAIPVKSAYASLAVAVPWRSRHVCLPVLPRLVARSPGAG